MIRALAILISALLALQPVALAGWSSCCACDRAEPTHAAGAAHECCPTEAPPQSTGETPDDEREIPSPGCDCKQSCCVGKVASPAGLTGSGAMIDRPEGVGPKFSEAPRARPQARADGLRRPPRAVPSA
jgi:hypothetical protein